MSKYRTVYNVLFFLVTVYGHDMRSFDDTILFKVNWPGKSNADLLESRPNLETYFITTANNEKYQCLIPDAIDSEDNHNEPYYGANPIEILSLLPKHSPCSYKVELYWTYELCHGKYVRQYHEDRDGKKVKIQEYYLGTFDKLQEMKLVAEYQERNLRPNRKAEIPVTKVDGINMPYVEIEMGDGTVCDINNKPRKVKVRYVCYQHGRHDLFSVKELVSCEYEVIVLSPVLCHHPDYKQQGTGGNEVNCLPVENAPKKPRALISMEMESLKLQHQKVTDDKPQKVYAILHVDQEGQDGEARVRVEIHPVDMIDKHNIEDSINSITDSGISPAEASPVKNFLSGKNCLHGGNGWWKYEFCYGRSVIQYHVERDGTKTTVNLGKFDKQKHLDWIAAHPHKKPKSPELRKQLSHFYSDGTICDKTGNPRQTEVKLKCVEGHTASPSSVSLFLLEPETCEYLLGVESPLICDILEYADSNGLLSEKFEDGEARVRAERNPVDMIDKHNMEDSVDSISDPGINPVEASPAKNFLSGKNCLHRAHGWWKYEFCYGRSVIQYNVERDGTETPLYHLGIFDKQKHLDWIAAHPDKKPKSPELRKELSHFYSGGTICEQTGKLRQIEVKLKCVEGHTADPSSVSLFLLEPETCVYLLGVESPLICDILKHADSNGLLSEKFVENFDKPKTTAYHEYDDLDERIANGDD